MNHIISQLVAKYIASCLYYDEWWGLGEPLWTDKPKCQHPFLGLL